MRSSPYRFSVVELGSTWLTVKCVTSTTCLAVNVTWILCHEDMSMAYRDFTAIVLKKGRRLVGLLHGYYFEPFKGA